MLKKCQKLTVIEVDKKEKASYNELRKAVMLEDKEFFWLKGGFHAGS